MEELSELDYEKVWSRFYSDFKFEPSVESRKWPGIKEPMPSITISLTEDGSGNWVQEDDLVKLFIEAFGKLGDGNRIKYILDWCHQCYYAPEELPDNLWVYPDGDYAILLSDDFKTGTFGHPWEKTICIFGGELIEIFESLMPKGFVRKLRENI